MSNDARVAPCLPPYFNRNEPRSSPSLNTSILRSPFSRSTLTVSAVEGSARPTSGSFPMHSMVLDAPRRPLRLEQRPDPKPGPGEVRVRVEACAVCRTDLHIVDGELPLP